MKRLFASMVVFVLSSLTALSNPIKGLVDIATGREVPDADLRYLKAGVTNNTGYFTNLYVQTNASNDTQVVNWRTMTNWTAGISTDSGVLTNSTTMTLATTNQSTFTMGIGGSEARCSRSMVYYSGTNGFPSDRTVTFSVYSTTNQRGEDCVFRNTGIRLFGVFLTNSVAAGATNLLVTDSSGFLANDLVYLPVASQEFVRVAAVATGNLMLESPTLYGHPDTTGAVSRVSELDFDNYHCTDGTSNLCGKIVFPSSVSVQVGFRTIYKR